MKRRMLEKQVKDYLVNLYKGDKCFATTLSVGHSYRVERKGKVIQSGVLSPEERKVILRKLSKTKRRPVKKLERKSTLIYIVEIIGGMWNEIWKRREVILFWTVVISGLAAVIGLLILIF